MASNNFTSFSSAASADTASADFADWYSGLGDLAHLYDFNQETQANHTSTPNLSPGQPDLLQNTPPTSASTGANVPFNPVDSNDFTGVGALERDQLQLQNNVFGFVNNAATSSQWMSQQLPAQQQQPEQQLQDPLGEQQLPSQMGAFDEISIEDLNNFDINSIEWGPEFCIPGATASLETAACSMNNTIQSLENQQVQQQPTQALPAEQPSKQQPGTLSNDESNSLFGDFDMTVPSQEENQPQTINLASLMMIPDLDEELPPSLLPSLDSYNQKVEDVQPQWEQTPLLQQQPTPPASQTLLPMPSQPMSPIAAATQFPSPVEGEQRSQLYQGQLVDINGQPTTPGQFQNTMTMDYENNVLGSTQLGAAQQPTPDSSSVAGHSSPDATITPKKARRKAKGKGKGNGVTTNNNNTNSQAGPSFDTSNALGPHSTGRVDKEKKKLGRDSCDKCRKSKTGCHRSAPNAPCDHCTKKGWTCVTTGSDNRTHKAITTKHSAMIDHYTALAREVCAQILCFETPELRSELFAENKTTPVGSWLLAHRANNLSPEGVPRVFECLEVRRDFRSNKLVEQRNWANLVERDCKIFLGSLLRYSHMLQSGEIDIVSLRVFKREGWLDTAYVIDCERSINDASERIQANYGRDDPKPVWPESWHAQFTAGQAPNTAIQF